MQKFGSTCKDVEYRTVIDLLDNLIPATLDVYAILFRSGSFDQYVETVFRIWTFALRWKRKNYNKDFYQIYFIGKIIITQLLMQLKIIYHVLMTITLKILIVE